MCLYPLFDVGKPAEIMNRENPDWVPCQNMGYSFGSRLKKPTASERWKRLSLRQANKQLAKEVEIQSSTSVSYPEVSTNTFYKVNLFKSIRSYDKNCHQEMTFFNGT